ncbi:benzoylformate decarboxylase [Steroidobacter sp.]|uniref:benzoylformate decarboxylase n=1 Tax=Steroidobacter sp. TaxID=1978227 RepID=UPI001A553054|nr:benzoylformate decarboxylase [Steroidobacter sp.]MBL8272083.1 benzoylformate decarboxylase [Steroidobacter sp.]
MARQTTVRDVVFDLLRAFGMTTIFGNPGSTELPLFRGFPSDFKYELGLQESIVVGMADGFAQATRNAAFVNLHSAAGLGHALGNVFTAHKNQTPLVIAAGQQARSMLPYEPFLHAREAAEFPRPYVKWACEPARAEDVPAAIARAYYTAMQAPSGPTFVSIPVDDWDRSCEPVIARQVSRTVRGDPELLRQAAEALSSARRPAIVVGASVARDAAWEETIALAERHEAAVWVSPMSARNSFPENHRLFAGFLFADRAKIVSALKPYDLVLVLGAPVFTYHVEGSGPFVPPTTKLIQLVDDPAMAAWSPVGASIVTSLKAGIEDLLKGAPPLKRAAPSLSPRPLQLAGTELSDAYLLQQIAKLRPTGSVIVEEAPSSRSPMHDYLPIVAADGFYTCASGGLGYGLPAAVGVAMGRPGAKVIAILGDGSSMYAIQGLWSAAQRDLPIAFVIVRNGGYEALNEFGVHFAMDQLPGVQLPGLDFCGLARSQGVAATRVRRVDELDSALHTAFAARSPMLVEVNVSGGIQQ